MWGFTPARRSKSCLKLRQSTLYQQVLVLHILFTDYFKIPSKHPDQSDGSTCSQTEMYLYLGPPLKAYALYILANLKVGSTFKLVSTHTVYILDNILLQLHRTQVPGILGYYELVPYRYYFAVHYYNKSQTSQQRRSAPPNGLINTTLIWNLNELHVYQCIICLLIKNKKASKTQINILIYFMP